MRKVLSLVLGLCILAAPAYADFAALERSTESGNIIYDVSPSYYLGKDGTALTEASIASIPTEGYSKTGLTADGNTRLILRYQASSAGSVTFSLSANMSSLVLESLTGRQPVNSPIRTTQLGNVYQASAVLTAPETWPSDMTFPKDTFTVTALFTPDNGEAVRETLTLTLQAPSVVLIHGIFSNNTAAFGYNDPEATSGIWPKLNGAGLEIISWNYDPAKGPKAVISDADNPLAKTLIDAFDALNAQGIASTRADIVAHSQGGLMARQFLRNDFDTGNKSELSYKQGMIRRVITIGTPNLGSPIASYLSENFSSIGESWQNWQAKSVWENICVLLQYFAFKKYKALDAMADMSNNSEFLSQLGYPDVPFHSIYGKVLKDNEVLNNVIDAIESGDIVSLSRLTWLPQQFVDLLTSSNGAFISQALSTVSDQIRIRELFGALFNGEDHDLCVSEKSAADIFPENARTAFEGLVKHNHAVLCKQDDVSSRVLELLKGGTANFMISDGVSAAQYDRAFDEYVSRYAEKFRASDEALSDFIDDSLSLSAADPEKEYLGDDGDEPQIQSVKISGNSTQAFSEDIYVTFWYGNGTAKFFKINGNNGLSFDKSVWANASDTGIIEVSFCTIQDGKLKVSPSERIIVKPLLYNVSGITIPAKKIYLNVDDNVHLELTAHTPRGNYDIAAPALKIAEWTVKDTDIAKVTDEGYVVGLKAGTTTLTASAEGFTTSVIVEVLGVSGSSSNGNPGSSGGGCNAGFTALMLLSAAVLSMKRR